MTEEPRETQQELFEEFSAGGPKRPERFPSINKTQKPILISTTLEQLLMAGIIAVLVLCGVFFLGVLRGKSLQRPIMAPVSQARPPQAARSLPAAHPAPAGVMTARSAAAAAPTPAKQLATLALSPDKPYTIQVVTHRKQELAEQEVAKLRRMGYVSFIIPSGEYFQVCAGQYANKDEARKDLAFFASRFKDCFLRHR